MPLRLRPNDPVPLYRQLVAQVRLRVAAGNWPPGFRLPSHRDLSRELVVNALTVKKAYDILTAEGLLEIRPGLGTFVRSDLDRAELAEPARVDFDALLAAVARAARRLGLPRAEVVRRLEARWRAIDADEESENAP